MGFPAIAAQLGITIGLWALNRLLRDDEKKLPKPQPQELEFSQTTIGTPIPYVAGTVRVNPVLIWHDNHSATAQADGSFRYKLDMLLAVGTPMWDEASAPWSSWRSATPPHVRTLWYGDRKIPLVGLSSGTQTVAHGDKAQVIVTHNGPVLEAGVHFYDGRSDQTLAGQRVALKMAVAGIDAADIPGYRHRMLLAVLATPGSVVVLDPSVGSIGTDPRVASIAVEVSALGPQPIGIDANPAWVLYDLLCRPVWGLGIDPDDVDLDSFQAAADILEDEGHGCSIVIERAEDAARVFAAIESQVDGVVYEDPSTGKITLDLIRNDYDPDDPDEVPVINIGDIVDDTYESDDIHLRDCPNEMRVNYTDRARGYKKDTTPWQRDANAAARGSQRRPTEFDAPGCMTAELAAEINARELAVVSRPLRSIKLKVSRKFYALKPGRPVKVNLPDEPYLIDNEIYRVGELDFGQLADGAIKMRLIRDVFDQATYPPPHPQVNPDVFTLPPLTERVFAEAPWFLQYLLNLAGDPTALTTQRILALAAPEAGSVATLYRCLSQSGGTTGILNFGAALDQGIPFFPTTALVATDYPATAAPYDTTTGLLLESVDEESGTVFADLFAAEDEIATTALNLALVGGEFIAFESVTDEGGGQFKLHNVWRELLGTAAADHPEGERFYLVDTRAIGRRAWPVGHHARGQMIASYKQHQDGAPDGVHGSDDIQIVGRAALPPPAADVGLSGYDLEGTLGDPAITETAPLLGRFKACSRVEAGINIAGNERDREAGLVVRGDETGHTAEAGTTWDVLGRRVSPPAGEDAEEVEIVTGLTAPAATGLTLGAAGHGEIDVLLRSKNGGLSSWQDAAVRVTAPRWRALLANDSAEYAALAPGWTAVNGTLTTAAGTNSLTREATGRWFAAVTSVTEGADGVSRMRQTIDVTGYRPGGLVAVVTWYGRNMTASGVDFSKVTIAALDENDSVLDSTTSGEIIGATGHWRRSDLSLTLPNATRKIRVDVAVFKTDGAGGGSPSDTAVTRIRLRMLQGTAELLTNGSFDGASLASWTNVTNSFTTNTGSAGASNNGSAGAAQGGAFSSSEIKQEASVAAGYKHGVAVLTGLRGTAIAGDTGEIVLQVLNGGGSVIASATTGAEAIALDTWAPRQLAVQLPDGAVTLRVRLLANRAAGAGNSGALFDDLSLRIHKDLDPRYEQDFDFREPSWQPLAESWARFHLHHPALPMPTMVWGGLLETPSVQPTELLTGPTHAWSDSPAPHSSAKFTGFYDIGPHRLFSELTHPSRRYVGSTSAYQFARAVAGSAVDIQALGADDTTDEEYGAFSLSDPFTLAVHFRTTELAWSTAAGLVGRRGNTGIGWGLQIDAGGLLKAILQGASGTATATDAGADPVTDRVPRWAFLVHDPAATGSELQLWSEGSQIDTASTSGIGAIDVAGVPLRIGRDGPSSATGGLQIARVYLFDAALTGDQIGEIVQYGHDPSALLEGYITDQAIWVPGQDDNEGATLVRYSTDHTAIAYSAARGEYGLVTAAASDNKIPSSDFTISPWIAETGVTLTQAIADPTGLRLGVRVANAGADQALRVEDLMMGVGTPLSVVFYARTTDGVARTLGIELLDSDENPIDITTASLPASGLWQRFHVQLGPWADDTPSAILRFALGAVGTFDLCHAIWADFGDDAPFALQDAGEAISDTRGSQVIGVALQGNHEGELYAEGVAAVASPPANGVIVAVDNDSDTDGERVLYVGAAAAPTGTLYDDASTTTDVEADPIDWREPWSARLRWCAAGLPESAGDEVGIVVDGSADSIDYASVAFAVGTSALAAIRIGGGDPALGSSGNMILSRVIVRAREPKIFGE